MRRPSTKVDSQSLPSYHTAMSKENDNNLINFIAATVEVLRTRVEEVSEKMATKVDLANLEDKLEGKIAGVEASLREDMATKEDLARFEASLREDMATKNDLSRLETTMHGEFEQVHIRLDSIDRRVDTRVGQIETDVSRLRSVVYLLVKDKPDMLRLLGQPTPRESSPQG